MESNERRKVRNVILFIVLYPISILMIYPVAVERSRNGMAGVIIYGTVLYAFILVHFAVIAAARNSRSFFKEFRVLRIDAQKGAIRFRILFYVSMLLYFLLLSWTEIVVSSTWSERIFGVFGLMMIILLFFGVMIKNRASTGILLVVLLMHIIALGLSLDWKYSFDLIESMKMASAAVAFCIMLVMGAQQDEGRRNEQRVRPWK